MSTAKKPCVNKKALPSKQVFSLNNPSSQKQYDTNVATPIPNKPNSKNYQCGAIPFNMNSGVSHKRIQSQVNFASHKFGVVNSSSDSDFNSDKSFGIQIRKY